MKLRALILSFIWTLVAVHVSSPNLAAQSGDAAAGKAVYTKSCAGCHGAAGEGKDTLAKALKVEMRHLGSKEVQEKTDEDLRKDIVEGFGKMRPMRGLNDTDLRNVLAYTRGLAES